jgi:hypothetical protein
MVQPDCAAVIPFGPVSWYGVASPWADSGFAGTMMSQLTLAAVVVAVLVVADAVGHGAAELIGVVGAVPVVAVPEAAAVDEAVPEAAAVGAAVPEAAAVGDAVLPAPWWPCPAVLAGTTYAAGDAQLAFAASARLFAPEWSTMMTIAPTATASATGMATGAMRRASGRLDRRRADRCLLGMQSTSMS